MKISILKGGEVFISESVMNSILVIVILTLIAIKTRKEVKKARVDEAPSNFLSIIELLIDFSNSMVRENMGQKYLKGYGPFMAMLISYLAVANLLGVAGLTPPTSDYSVTLTLAIIVFGMVQYTKFRNRGGLMGYFKGFAEPIAFITPINIISEFSNPISLSFRLFGNIMSGSLIMALLYSVLGYFAPIVTAPLQLYFDVFVGLLQSYVFLMLTMVYITSE